MWWFNKKKEEKKDVNKTPKELKKEDADQYINVHTADGKLLKKIKGGWSLMGTGGDEDESGIRSHR